MTGFLHPVPRGKGGWGTAEQTFMIRGKEYLQDEEKVLYFIILHIVDS